MRKRERKGWENEKVKGDGEIEEDKEDERDEEDKEDEGDEGDEARIEMRR